jgi:hypothetical protein
MITDPIFTPDENRRDSALALLEQAKQFQQRQQFGDANRTLVQLIAFCDDDAALEDIAASAGDLLNHISIEAPRIAEGIRSQLDIVLNQDVELNETLVADVTDTDAYLEELNDAIDARMEHWHQALSDQMDAWENALLEADDRTYRNYQNKVNRSLSKTRQDLFVNGVIELCDRLWQRADESIQSDDKLASPAEVLTLFLDKALNVANHSLNEYRDDTKLITLVRRAKERRESFATAAQVKTSAVEGETYVTSLQQLDGLPPDARVADYNFSPNQKGQLMAGFSGYVSVSESRQLLQELAEQWASSKAKEYLARAEAALREHNPVLALEELANRSKIDQFLQSVERGDFEKVEVQARDELARLEQADQQADLALEILPDSALRAWALYEEAQATYEWSPKVREVRGPIIAQLQADLERQLQAAQHAYEQRDFDTARQINQTARNEYGNLPALSPQLGQVEGIVQQADDYVSRKRQAREELARINQLATDRPAEAVQSLDEFETDYQDVLPDLDNLAVIQSNVRLRSNADVEYLRLKTFLRNDDLTRVGQAVKETRQANQQYSEKGEFARLLEDLELHHLFLSSQREANAGQFEKALAGFEKVARVSDHLDAASADTRAADIAEKLRDSQAVENKLQNAEAMLKTDPVEAYHQLQGISDNYNREQREQRDRLTNEARNRAQREIETRMAQWRTANSIPLEACERDLEALKQLRLTDAYNRWNKELGSLMAAQAATDLGQQAIEENSPTIMEAALAEWTEAIKRADEAGQRNRSGDYQKQQNQAQRDYAELLLETARASLEQFGSNARVAQETVENAKQVIEELREHYAADAQIMLWQAQLSAAIARNSLDTKERKTQFQAAADGARSVQNLPKKRGANAQFAAEARNLAEVAQRGSTLAEHMQTLQQLFGDRRSVGALRRALALWEDEIEPHTHDETFHRLGQWWSDLKTQTVQTLQTEIGTAEQISTDQFRAFALLLMLDEKNTPAHEGLSKLPEVLRQVQADSNGLIDGSATANGIPGQDGYETLKNQLTLFHERLADLESIDELVEFFIKDVTLTRRDTFNVMKQINDEVKPLKERLKNRLTDLQGLDRSVSQALDQLRSHQQSGDFTTDDYKVRELLSEWRDHPATRYVAAELARRKEQRSELETQLGELQHLIDSANYVAAVRQMSQLNENTLAEYGLISTLNIVDPDTHMPALLWADQTELINRLSGGLGTIMAFVEQFDDYSSGQGRMTGTPQETTQRRMIDWAEWKDGIDSWVAIGEFGKAREYLYQAINGVDEPGWLALKPGLGLLNQPPFNKQLTEDEQESIQDSVERRYQLAIVKAGSERGQELLNYVRERRSFYQRNLADAETMAENIDAREQAWASGWREWEAAIQSIAVQFDRAGGVDKAVRGGARQQMKNALQQGYAAFQKCQQACSERTTELCEMIDEEHFFPFTNANPYQGLWLYRRAAEKTAFNPLSQG